MLNGTNIIILALAGGIVPALFWLWFWLREDRLKPEPKLKLIYSFFLGMIAVFFALLFELLAYYFIFDANPLHLRYFPGIIQTFLNNITNSFHLISNQDLYWQEIHNFFSNWLPSTAENLDIKKFFLIVLIAPVIEEVLKLTFTYMCCLLSKENDEPIDASIYLLTSALGFAAVETALFLVSPLTNNNIIDSMIAINFRSIGPMLIHIVSSATLGLIIGLAFYKSRFKKMLYLAIGLITAIIIHILFNLFIIMNSLTNNIYYFWIACLGTWIFVIILLIFFEKIKKVAR